MSPSLNRAQNMYCTPSRRVYVCFGWSTCESTNVALKAELCRRCSDSWEQELNWCTVFCAISREQANCGELSLCYKVCVFMWAKEQELERSHGAFNVNTVCTVCSFLSAFLLVCVMGIWWWIDWDIMCVYMQSTLKRARASCAHMQMSCRLPSKLWTYSMYTQC